jgi:tetratricopeptide (TPR) repeat protein
MSRSPVAPVLRPAAHGTASATPEESADLPTADPGTLSAPGRTADVEDDGRTPGAEAGAPARTTAGAGAQADARPEADADATPEGTAPEADAESNARQDTAPEARAHAPTNADDDAPVDARPQDHVEADADATRAGAGGGTAPEAQAEDEVEVESEPRLRGALRTAAIVCGLALALTAGGIVVGAGSDGQSTRTSATRTVDTPVMGLASADLNTAISGLQTHLRAQPKDGAGWATLGAAYVEQARTSGDPTRYPQAEEAFKRSMTIQPRDNDSALAGRAALAAARHDFDSALRYADRALAVNPYSERALAVRIDALVELGRYDDAYTAAEHADSLRPGIPVFTRLAYVKELRGDPAGSRKVLLLALDQASSTGDIAYVATAIGHLAWEQGDYTEALKRYGDALRASPDYIPALEGRGRTLAARGDMDGALRDLSEVVQRYPLPAELAALGEVYEVMGQGTKARQHYSVVGTWIALARANGVATDLDTALVAADHGDPAEALRAARAEWDRRHSVHTADAMAWALHVNGQDKEALGYAKQALAPGYRNALFLYHRGMIERALGDREAARRSLTDAMELNPGFSPTGAKAARAALKDLGGAEAGR